MKKLGFLFPLLFILMFAVITPKFFSGSINAGTMLMFSGVLLLLLVLLRPKKSANKSAAAIAEEILGEFAGDAFGSDEALKQKFDAVLSDLGANLPKAAVSKLQKLAPLCTGKEEQYAVAMASAYAWKKQNNFRNAAREYNKAVVIHPTADLAYAIGDCHQRLGDLDKARDSYDFALELDPKNAKYPSSIATTYVGDGDYDTAMDYASDALALDESYPQALATMAICYGVKGETMMHKHYRKLASNNGYSESKISSTIDTLKKRDKR